MGLTLFLLVEKKLNLLELPFNHHEISYLFWCRYVKVYLLYSLLILQMDFRIA